MKIIVEYKDKLYEFVDIPDCLRCSAYNKDLCEFYAQGLGTKAVCQRLSTMGQGHFKEIKA